MAEGPTLLSAPAAAAEAAPDTALAAPAVEQDTQQVDATTEQSADASASWRDGLPDELKQDATLARYKSPEAVYKAFLEARKLASKKAEGLAVPGPDAKPEDVQAFNQKMREINGVPESPDKYELPTLDTLPDGMPTPPQEIVGAFTAKAHELALSPSQVQGLYAWFMGDIEANNFLGQRDFAQKAADAGLVALQKEYAGQTKTVIEDAKKALAGMGLEDVDLGFACNNPRVIKALAALAPQFKEGGLKGQGHTEQMLTPEEARAKGREMMRDPRYSDQSRRDPAYMRQVQEHFARYFPGEHRKNP